MKTSVLNFMSFILLLLPQLAFGASNEVAAAVQRGLFEEEANHNFSEAIAAYQSAIAQFDDARSLAATAVFRLGEVYRKLGKTNEANLHYQRILREFSDQSAFAGLSRSYLGASGKVESASAPTTNATANSSLAVLDIVTEEEEIRRIQKLIAESPDLLNAGDASSGQTPLHKAAAKGELLAAQFLLTNSANVNVRDRVGKTPLYEAAAANHKEMVGLLSRAGADPNSAGGDYNYTPLHVAAERAQKAIVEALLGGGANPNARNNYGVTPLHLAVSSGFKSIVEVLLAQGADPNIRINTQFNSVSGPISGSPLEIAIGRSYPAIAELLLSNRADPNQKGSSGGSALNLATINGRKDMAEMLLDHGANANSADNNGSTALMSAAERADRELVRLFLARKADVKAKDKWGLTALHYLVSNGSQRSGAREVAELLLKAGADVNALDGAGQTPLRRLNGAQAGFGETAQPLSEQSKLAALLRERGGLEDIPDFSAVRLSRSHLKQPVLSLFKDTNGLNNFSIMELVANYYERLNKMPSGDFSLLSFVFPYSERNLPFPDPSAIRIIRPRKNDKEKEQISVNLLLPDNTFDCAKDAPLQFGDVVEIPEREHALSEPGIGLTTTQLESLGRCIRRKVTFIIKGQSLELKLLGHSEETYLSAAMHYAEVQNRLRTSSDLTAVKIIRTDPTTKQKKVITENILPFWKSEKPIQEDLWLRDGDVIEVFEKQ